MTAEETAAKIISKVGLWWPLAEEDQLRTAAGGYEACSSAIHAAATTGQAGAKLVTGGNTGKAFTAFDTHWDQYHAGLPATAQACDQVAKALREFADQVDSAKKKIIDLAIEIGATIAVGVGMAIFSFGATAAAAAARTAMLVRRGLTIATGLTGVANTIVSTILVGAIFGAVEGFVTGIVAQVGKQVLNDGPGITLSETMAWTGYGAAGGAVLSGAGLAARSALRRIRPPTMGSGKPKLPANFKPPTNPAQLPPTSIPKDWSIRRMPPTKQYPDGYWILRKPMLGGKWQPIDPSTMKPGKIKGGPDTHVPLPPAPWPGQTGVIGGGLGNLGATGHHHDGSVTPSVR